MTLSIRFFCKNVLLVLTLFFSIQVFAEPLRTLYPEIEPYHTGYFQASPIHKIYYEESGNPNGKPVIFLHGGPGAGTDPKQRRFFDPKAYRIILFDQRGCGKSTPLGSLVNNTVPALVEDIETLRKLLKIEKWMVFGGSFGSSLALAYAEAHPEVVTQIILRGIFLGSESENRWVAELGGVGRLYPDLWKDYISVIPKENRQHIMNYYYNKIRSNNLEEQKKYVLEWENYEERLSYEITPPRLTLDDVNDQMIAAALIETEYFTHHLFLKPYQLIEQVRRIRHIPAVIIQGRHDLLCPLENAYRLHQVWPEAEFYITEGAGHSAYDDQNTDRLIRATDKYT